jgi:hypothetical protein
MTDRRQLPVDRSVPLKDASIQALNLELIRRASFNEFDGPRVADSLERHADLWLGAWMTRFGVHREEHPNWYPAMSLIALRDLPRDHWNVDTLVILVEDVEKARELAAIAEAENWDADDVHVEEHEEEISMALGISPANCWLLSLWWD